jgi:iron complex outermembrane recepter protein
MKKVLGIFISIALSLSISTSLAVAEETKKEEAKLEEIVVTATKTEREIKDVSTNVTVITRDDIERYQARDVSELLQQIPGFNLSVFGGVHADMYVSSRGNPPMTRGAQILVDGIEYNNSGGYFNVLAIPIGDIERIEVVKNPSSALYGNFGTGGVLNIITRKPAKPLETKASASYGSFDTQQYSAVLNGALKNWEYYVEGRYYKSDGWQENSWEENELFNAKVKYNLDGTSTIGLHINYAPIKNGYPGTLTKEQFNEEPRQTTQPFGDNDSYAFLSALFFDKSFGNSKVFAKVKYGLQEFELIDGGYFEGHNYTIVPEVNYSLSHTIGGMSGLLLIGSEYRYYNNDKSRSYASPDGTSPDLTKSGLYQDRSLKDNTWAFFAQEELEVMKKLLVSFGVRYDYVDTHFVDKLKPERNFDKTHSAWSPKIGVTYTLSNELNVFANYSRGFKNPTTAVSSYSNNPDLKPEIIDSYELGVRGQPASWLYYNLALFLVDTDDKIVRVGGPRNVENVGKTRSSGCEAGVNVDFRNGFHGSINYTYVESEFREYTTLAGVSYNGKELPLVPNHVFGAGIGYKSPLIGQIDLTANYASKKFIDNANMGTLGSYTILDAKYQYAITKNVGIFLVGKNLTDERYVDVGFGSPGAEMLYPMPGRSITGGINLSF